LTLLVFVQNAKLLGLLEADIAIFVINALSDLTIIVLGSIIALELETMAIS